MGEGPDKRRVETLFRQRYLTVLWQAGFSPGLHPEKSEVEAGQMEQADHLR